MDVQYESPEVREVGRVHELTMQDKVFGVSDGVDITVGGQTIGNSSQN
jgi:hypothetical protein